MATREVIAETTWCVQNERTGARTAGPGHRDSPLAPTCVAPASESIPVAGPHRISAISQWPRSTECGNRPAPTWPEGSGFHHPPYDRPVGCQVWLLRISSRLLRPRRGPASRMHRRPPRAGPFIRGLSPMILTATGQIGYKKYRARGVFREAARKAASDFESTRVWVRRWKGGARDDGRIPTTNPGQGGIHKVRNVQCERGTFIRRKVHV